MIIVKAAVDIAVDNTSYSKYLLPLNARDPKSNHPNRGIFPGHSRLGLEERPGATNAG